MPRKQQGAIGRAGDPKGVVIVTGGSRGIGAATASAAAEKGYSVCINYARDEEAADLLVQEIVGRGGRALAVRADVSDEADVVRLFQHAERALGPITALVNNAGVLGPQLRVRDVSASRLSRIFAINVFGTILCSREAVRRMSTLAGGSGGSIVNVSSVASRTGSPNEYVDYAASKGAIDTFTVGLAREVANEGIRVNAVRPGVIYTDIHATGGEPGRVDRVKETVPMRRGGRVDEVAAAILWLVSAEASYATGAILDVTGGA